ncbi:MAG TPA: NYN domain-containing protein, partial [Longilinea sp.]|nr:NYN domain-containing protein [Longilinea sp.]
MWYLIDGHNLIPKLGLRLDDPQDEMALVQLLQVVASRKRAKIDVYFDGAPPGQAGTRRIAGINAHFVPLGRTADDALAARLAKLGQQAKQYCLVSSDRRVQQEGHNRHAQVMSSEEFALVVRSAQEVAQMDQRENGVESQEDIETWINLFNSRN